MRSVQGFAALAALLVLGVDAQSVPTCAQPCVNSLLSSSGCQTDDVVCICSNQQFISEISCCIIPVCDAAGIASAISFADQICGVAGVTNLPTTATCASTASSTGSSATSSTASATSSVVATTTGSVTTSTTSFLIETQPVPSCFRINASDTSSCVIRPVPQTATDNTGSSTNTAATTSPSSLTGAAASSLTAAESSLASSLSSASAQSTSSSSAAQSTATAGSTSQAAATTTAAGTTTAAATGNVANVNSVGMGFAGGAVGLIAGLVGVLL